VQTNTTIGLDIAKLVFQVSCIGAAGNVALRRQQCALCCTCSRQLVAQGCRLGQCSEVGSFVGYTGRTADIVAATAHDPMYGAAVRCKRSLLIWQSRSCINVSGL
jgi:hypothetical protein